MRIKSIFKKNYWLLVFVFFVLFFFSPFILQGKLPIPADTLIGLYHPWRDSLSDNYPNGIPVKNPLITDPVRQQYPSRYLAIEQLKKGQWPSWNPYVFSGTPLLANIQSAVFYPLNIIFWFTSFPISWSILILFQPLLAGVFTYFYLDHFRLDKRACFLGALAFAFSGFMVAWMEWNTIGHVALWLPLALLAKDKLVEKFNLKWAVILIFSETSALLAGHLQTALYFLIFINVYLAIRLWQKSSGNVKDFLWSWTPFIIKAILILILILPQFLPSYNFITQSARNFDLPDWQRADWFIPWQHLLQFITPDFFGNPATGNYWGVWNYGEFVGYIGLIPLAFALYAIIFRRDKKTYFYIAGVVGALLLALPTPIGKLQYQLNIPFLSTLQPSRIMVLIDFSLAILATLGFDYFLRQPVKSFQMIKVLAVFTLVFSSIWIVVLFGKSFGFSQELITNLTISKRNFILPTFLFGMFVIYVLINTWKKNKLLLSVTTLLLLIAVSLDLLRFNQKFNLFTDASLLFPQTQTIEFLQKSLGSYRYLTTDRELIPPNVSTYYKLQTVEGYDPLYLQSYGELMAAWTRNRPYISPAAFNRILTPQNYDSFLADLLGVKYILSLTDQVSPKLKLVFQEGETRVYENTSVLPRTFLVEEIRQTTNKEDVIKEMFNQHDNLEKVAITDSNIYVKPLPLNNTETATITEYSENRVVIRTITEQERMLVLTDIYYPDWKVFINGHESSIFPVDYNLRGVMVPKGESKVEFKI